MGIRRENEIIKEIIASVSQWGIFASEAKVDENQAQSIQNTFRLLR
jgi:hypothetical protein